MSAPVAEAHRALALQIQLECAGEYDLDEPTTAQLIADSEAKATAELRAERDSIKQEIEMVEHRAYRAEAKISNQAERIRYLEGATNHATGTPLSQAIARAARAEAELDGIRALADRRNKRYHVDDTTHQLVAALDQALDIAQAELAAEREKVRVLQEAMKFSANKDKYLQAQFYPCQRASAAMAATEDKQ